jgi:DNA polymerase-4
MFPVPSPAASVLSPVSSPTRTREFDWLFLDLNSYFASVEQQDNPKLRGKPVAVVPVETDHTCAIAASYEAKKFGIKTGTGIREARLKCPDLVCVLADHKKYVVYQDRILKEIDRHVPIEIVVSVDELACRLYGDWRTPEGAAALARRIKAGIAKNVGRCLTSSIGISTNRFLAKTASDMQKPDGLVLLHPEDLPQAILHLELHDLCGIGPNMEKRLWRAGIYTMADLWACAPKQLRAIWGSVAGERLWHKLRGVELPEEPTRRSMIGHSHVLAPEERSPEAAGTVIRRLLLKAASRLRDEGFYATQLDIGTRVENGPRLGLGTRLPPVRDSLALLDALAGLWSELTAQTGPCHFKKVSVTLHGLIPADELRQLELFGANGQFAGDATQTLAQQRRQEQRERLSAAMEEINKAFGRDSITLGTMPGDARGFTGAKVAFNRIPKLRDFAELNERRKFPDKRSPKRPQPFPKP